MTAPDITREPTLYVVPYAHLDTQWRWEFPQTISQFLLKTLRVNFDYIDKYPHYVMNWSGANRYRLMKEYYPNDYARMKTYVEAGRWFPTGSSVEEGDVNLPSAEGIFRQFLYGNTYFRAEFGKASAEYMIPDCFGFPASLPTLLNHAGIKGFSTQKLNAAWQPAPKVGGPSSPEQTPEGIPFNVGRWYGPDGSVVIAALNPGSYGSEVFTDLSKYTPPQKPVVLTDQQKATLNPRQQRALTNPPTEQDWPKRIALDGQVTGVFADYHYVGTGDVGGAAPEDSIRILEATVDKKSVVLPGDPNPQPVGNGPVHVIIATADQMFRDIKPDETSRMPTWTGDLELINHSAGSLTSEAFHKKMVVANEVLADSAEKASVAAAMLGARPYPQKRLDDAWMLALGGHFHDTAAGTATPRAYQFAWNDDLIVANQFAGVLTDATESIAASLDTSGQGTPLVVFNNLNIPREDVVSAKLAAGMSDAHIVDSTGAEVPSQTAAGKITFLAKAPSAGYTVFHIVPGLSKSTSTLKVSTSSLENARYKVTVNPSGDVSSVFDKQLNKELLSAPIRLAISNDTPKQWPAWNMDFDQEQAAPRAYVDGPADIKIIEKGPVRVALQVTRKAENSTFVQTISLAAGSAGDRVEFGNSIDWRGLASNVKAVFPLAASNPNATYNWEVGTVQRPNAFDRQFEVASHRWIDLTDKSGSFGATILTGAKNASDKRDDNTIRLTLLRSPGIQPGRNGAPGGYNDQANQDWGHHDFTFGLTGHSGDWRSGQTDWQGYRLNDPLVAFATTSHPGSLGKTFSLVKVSDPRIRVLALKKAETTEETILRLVELDGKPARNVQIAFPSPIASFRQVDAQEQHPETPSDAPATLNTDGTLIASFGAYQPRTFALSFGNKRPTGDAAKSHPVALTYDLAAATNDDTPATGGFDGKGNAYPAEMLPTTLAYDGIQFTLGAAATGKADSVTAKGQTIALPAGDHNRIYILAASSNGDQKATFKTGSQSHDLTIEDWGGFIGQWDTRLWNHPLDDRDWAISANHAVWPPADMRARENYTSPTYPTDYKGLADGFVKPASVAWYASHHHTAAGLNQPYQYSYLFAYAIDVPAGTKSITLPSGSNIHIFAITAAKTSPTLTPAQPLTYTANKHTTAPTQ
jgi:alpha-mannosidase